MIGQRVAERSLGGETPAKVSEETTAAAALYAARVVANARAALAVLDEDLRVVFASPLFFALMDAPGDAGAPSQLVPAALAAISQALRDGGAVEIEAPAQRSRILRLTAREIEAPRGSKAIVLSVEDAIDLKSLTQELSAAKAEAEQANRLRSRILAAANHTLRQPLQTICLVQGMLANSVSDPAARRLIDRLDQGVATMSEMLDGLLDLERDEPAPAETGIAGEAFEAARPQSLEALAPRRGGGETAALRATGAVKPAVYIVDDDAQVRAAMRDTVERHGFAAEVFADGSEFLQAYAGQAGCLIADAKMPGVGGVQMIERLKAMQSELPVIVITAYGDVAMAVGAMKAGAMDFLQKPVRQYELLDCIRRAFDISGEPSSAAERKDAEARVRALTARQRQILDLVLGGAPTKTIAADLNLSQRTVDNHRAAIMRKLGARSLPSLIRIALAGQGVRNAGMELG